MAGGSHHNPDPALLTDSEIYFASLGFWRGLEVTGRLIEGQQAASSGIRDLSLDLKYQFLKWPEGPRFAVGLQDYGGQTRFFRSKYAVVTWPWRSFSGSLGYGRGEQVLKGIFGGLEWNPSPYLSVLADHDGSDVHAGLRLGTGPWLGPVRATATVSYSDARDELEAGLTLHFPLGVNETPPAKSSPVRETAIQPTAAPSVVALSPLPPLEAIPVPRPVPGLPDLPRALARQGFEAVRVGVRPEGTVVIVLENRVYNHSFVDAVGVALATVAGHIQSAGHTVELTLTRYGVPHFTVEVRLDLFRQALRDGNVAALQNEWRAAYSDTLHKSEEIRWQETAVPLRAIELILEPLVRTFVGTEFGALDYGLGLRARSVVPLARGFVLAAGVQAPVLGSDDFHDGGAYETYAPKTGVDHVVFQYFHKPAPQWAWLWSAGSTQIFQSDMGVAGLEQLYVSDTGRHQWRAKLMALHASSATREVALGGYTWFDAPGRYSLSLTAGRFYAGETGGRIEVNRYFGDTILGFFWRAASRDDQVAGVQFSLPLTPRRDQTPEQFQLKGSRRWTYSLGSTVNASDGRNPLRPLLAFEPMLDLDLRRDFFDAGRLTPEYLESNTQRVLEAGAELPTGN